MDNETYKALKRAMFSLQLLTSKTINEKGKTDIKLILDWIDEVAKESKEKCQLEN